MARIKIDLERRLGIIDPMIYGMFIEHLDRCVYDGIFEPGSPLADAEGIRLDVLAACRRLKPPIIRYPGGNFVSGYHWLDGVGPKEQRPTRFDMAWNTVETNQFGTNEFIDYCRKFPTEPYLCVNMGTGTMDEAAAWVEYCNRAGDTSYAKLRKEHGYEQPHNVIYWGLGNEMHGDWQIGNLNAEDYAKKARHFAQVMKWTDKRIKLILNGGGREWDAMALRKCADLAEYISYHVYWYSTPGEDAHYSNLAQPYASETYIQYLWQLIQQVRRDQKIKHPILIAIDEWNVLYPDHGTGERKRRYNLTNALAVAIYMNMMRRNCQAVGMANLAQMVNLLPPIFTSPEGLFLQTIFYPLELAATKSGPIALDTYVECDSYAADYCQLPAVPYLDVMTSLDEQQKKLYVNLVNLNKDASQRVTIQVQDGVTVKPAATAYVVTGESPEVINDFGVEHVTCKTKRITNASNNFKYTLPPASNVVVELDLV